MSRHDITDTDREVWKRLEAFDLRERPLHDPLGDEHHTEMPFTEADKTLADDLAWFMGTMGWEESAVDQWRRVVRALRCHGLKLANDLDSDGMDTPEALTAILALLQKWDRERSSSWNIKG